MHTTYPFPFAPIIKERLMISQGEEGFKYLEQLWFGTTNTVLQDAIISVINNVNASYGDGPLVRIETNSIVTSKKVNPFTPLVRRRLDESGEVSLEFLETLWEMSGDSERLQGHVYDIIRETNAKYGDFSVPLKTRNKSSFVKLRIWLAGKLLSGIPKERR